MPAPKPAAKRSQVVVRLSEEALVNVDTYAKAEERTRSDMIRVLLREAILARRTKEARKR